MDGLNPYAPSQASLKATDPLPTADGASHTIWRDGDVLVKLMGAEMPHRCVKCNEPADPPTKARKVYWHHPGLYLLLLINALIYVIVAIAVRKKAFVSAGLCKEHKSRRRIAMTLSWTGALGGIVLMYFGADSSFGIWGMIAGLVVILASIVGGLIFGRTVYARKIDKTYVRLKGCGIAFLDSLPQFTES